MNATPYLCSELQTQDFLEMERMEIAYYGAEHTTPAVEAERWYRLAPHSILTAKDVAGICGFVNLFPVADRVLGLLRAGACNDRDLRAEDVAALPDAEETAHLFLSCIFVREDLRGTGFVYVLLDAAMRQYDALCADVLITDNATPAGAAFSKILGLHSGIQTAYGTQIHEGDYAAARAVVKERANRYQQSNAGQHLLGRK